MSIRFNNLETFDDIAMASCRGIPGDIDYFGDAVQGNRVSAVITAYNRPDYLRCALESAVSQAYGLHEIIVIDDGSSTDLEHVVNEFGDNRPAHAFRGQLTYHRLSSNRGANAARNKGVELASGDWVAFLDDDDVWLPEKVLDQVRDLLFNANSSKPIAGLSSYRFLENGAGRATPKNGLVDLDRLRRGNPYCGASGLIVRRQVIAEQRFDESLPCGQDWDIYIRLARSGNIRYLAKPLFLYRRGSHDGLTTRAKKMSISEAEQRLASTYKHREWLGERNFRIRAAGQILSYVFYKQNKLAWIRKATEIAGVKATAVVMFKKLIKRFNNGLKA